MRFPRLALGFCTALAIASCPAAGGAHAARVLPAQAGTGDISDPHELAILFPPNAIDLEIKALVVTPAQADDPKLNLAVGVHSAQASYSSSGMLSGYLEESVMDFGGGYKGSGQWLGSIFPTDDQAAAFENSTVSTLTSEGFADDPTFCGHDCHFFAFRISGATPVEFGYVTFVAHNVVGEVAVVAEGTIGQDLNALSSFETTLLNVSRSGEAAIGFSFKEPAIDVGYLSLFKKVKSGLKPAAVLKHGQEGVLQLPIKKQNLPGYSLRARVTFKSAGRARTFKMKKIGKALDGASIFSYTFKNEFATTEKVSATVNVTAGGQKAASPPLTFTLKGD